MDLVISAQEIVDAHESFRRGVELAHANKHADAVFAFSAAIARSPDWHKPYVERGVAYALLGNRKQARADLDRAVELSPTDERAHALLAAAKAGDWPQH